MTSSDDRAALLTECDRICGVHAKAHKSRCPVYKANCEAVAASNALRRQQRGDKRFRGRALIEFEVEARDYEHAVGIVSEPNFDPARFNWWAALPDSVEVFDQ